MYDGLAFIMAVCSLYGVTDSRVKVGCDNKKALFLLYKNVQKFTSADKTCGNLVSNMQGTDVYFTGVGIQ